MRLARAFEKHSDPDTAWKDLLSRQTAERQAAYTFDIRLDKAPAALDDDDSMDLVAQIARDAALNSPQLPPPARCIRAEHFVFEMDAAARLRLSGGAYHCVGHTLSSSRRLCASLRSDPLCSNARGDRFQAEARFSCPLLARHMMAMLIFCQTVIFQVPSRHAPYRIALQEGPSSVCDISGSLFTLDGLIKQQKLDAFFGREDHWCRKE